MSSVVCALGFLTCELNSRPTSECDCAFYQEVDKWLFHLAGCPAHHLHDQPGRQLVHHQRRLGQSSSDGLLFSKTSAQLFFRIFCSFLGSFALSQDLPPCTTLSRWRTWTAAWRRSRTATARAAMERQATTSATQDPVWLDGFNNWVCFNINGYFDLLPHLLIRNALNHPMHDGYYRSYVQQRGDHEFRRGQSHNG